LWFLLALIFALVVYYFGMLYNIFMQTSPQKAKLIGFVDTHAVVIWEIATFLFEHPETAFHEYLACDYLTNKLIADGFSVEKAIGGLDTAFRAMIGEPGLVVAILAEYDALPGLGHACGHNMIAASAIGAGLALSKLTDRPAGQLQIIGTPAEEGGGGKITLAQNGVFDAVQAALMFHPASKNMVTRGSLASSRLVLEFFGKASHAAAAPEEGINALDALLLAFNNINAIRPTLSPRDRIAGIVTQGGEACNIIPAYTSAKFSIRSVTARRRDQLIQRVIVCAQAGADALGCQLKTHISPGYAEIIPNPVLAELFTNNLTALGRIISEADPYERMGSTDMGDLSHIIPCIHPYLETVPATVAGHTQEFADLCLSQPARTATLDAAKALAMTVYDLLANPEYITQARLALDAYLSQQ
jgi:amidohydrolase